MNEFKTYKYQFSISLDGSFLFRTDIIDRKKDMEELKEIFIHKFPASAGYKITLNKFPAVYECEVIKA